MKRTLLALITIATVFGTNEAVKAQPAPGGPSPVITEIMYNPPETNNDTLEFVEIYNPSTTAMINMAGFYFSSGIDFTFPAGFLLMPNSYVLISGDSVIFEDAYGVESFEWEGQTSSLSNSGEGLTLRTSAGAIADTVFFDDSSAWPAEADGDGYSLVLCDPSADNNLPENWTLSENMTGLTVNGLMVYADPNEAATCTATSVADDNVITTIVYPNPSNGVFRMQIEPLNEAGLLSIRNTMGQLIHQQSISVGTTTLDLDIKMTPGHYFISVDTNDGLEHHKLVIH